MTTLCPPCARDDAGWRDAPMSIVDGGVQIITIGNRLQDALENRKRRVERYYALVRFQRDLIARQCAEQHMQPAQLNLFEVAA